MNDVSVFRLYVLRAMYLFIVIGLGTFLWPSILDPHTHWTLQEGQMTCMLAAFSILCLLGLRFPVQILPVLLWEVLWKTMWLAIVPLPRWLAGQTMDEPLRASVFACGMVILVYLAVPWGYVFRRLVTGKGERWR